MRPESIPPRRPLLLAALAAVALFAGCSEPAPTPAPTLERGAVSSPEKLAAEVGTEILGRGGNAVDAAIAVHFALAVTEPSAGNLGGGGFMVVHDPSATDGPAGGAYALDFRETAPADAHRDLFLDDEGNVVRERSLFTHLASGVPGSVRGMQAAHEKFGTLPWSELVMPAVRLAEEGFEASGRLHARTTRWSERYAALDPRYRDAIDFDAYYDIALRELFVQPELGATLRRIAEEGPDDFYLGRTAELIAEEMERGGGLIDLDDLALYRPVWRKPVEGSYRGRRVVSMPPPSSGGVALIEMLNMLETFEVPAAGSAERVHLYAEIFKRVFADRSVHLGDPDFFDVPVEMLTGKEYAAARAEGIALDARTDPAAISAGGLAAEKAESMSTTHFSVVDRNGMAVSCTTTLNSSFGSGIVVDGAGFLLNNEMDDFSAKPGAQNLYGVTGDEANAVAGGKRMLSSMSPAIVYDAEGAPRLVLGSPGGPTIFTTTFQVVVNALEDGMPLPAAVAAPRAHHQWPPRIGRGDAIYVEQDEPYALDAEVIAALEGLGYEIARWGTIGDVQAIEISGRDVVGVADGRRGGHVAYASGDDRSR